MAVEREINIFSPFHDVRTGSVAHSASSPMGTEEQEREVGHSPPSSAEIENGGAIPPSPKMSSCRDTSLLKHRNNVTILSYLIKINF
jgi:hypothetical protein